MNCPTSRSGCRADFSTDLADDLVRGKIDVAFLRTEPKPDLAFRLIREEPLVVVLPSHHPLARKKALRARDLLDRTFIGISDVAPVLRASIANYLGRCDVKIMPAFEVDNFAMAMSLVASTGGLAILPASIRGYLPGSIASRPFAGAQPSVGLAVGYHRANTSPLLKSFLSKNRRRRRSHLRRRAPGVRVSRRHFTSVSSGLPFSTT